MNILTYNKYIDLAAQGVVDPSKLPPSESAAYLHGLRTILQVKVWKNLDTQSLDPCDYGWSLEDGIYAPIKNNDPCAPEDLLKVVRCKCKGGCRSANCSCKKHGLTCAAACKNCRGYCENSQVICKITLFRDNIYL